MVPQKQYKEEIENITITGKIENKVINEKGGPKCFFYLEDSKMKLVCWSETFMKNFDVGDEVIVTYIPKPNEYNGKVYINYTIKSMNFKNKSELHFTDLEKEELEKVGISTSDMPSPRKLIKSENGKIKLGGLYYQIKDIELELITS